MTGNRSDNNTTLEDQSRCTVPLEESELVNKPRPARVAEYNGTHIGVCIFLTMSELRALGINLSQTETDLVDYAINEKTSRLAIRPRNQ